MRRNHYLDDFGSKRNTGANHPGENRPPLTSNPDERAKTQVKDLNDMLRVCPSHSKSALSRPALESQECVRGEREFCVSVARGRKVRRAFGELRERTEGHI